MARRRTIDRTTHGSKQWAALLRLAAPVLAALTVTGSVPVSAAGPALSAADVQVYTRAFAAADADDWRTAMQTAAQASDPLLTKVLQWLSYADEATPAGFAEITAFIANNPDWPRLSVLRRRAEERWPANVPADQTIAWFYREPPLTAAGTIALADALRSQGREDEAREVVRQRWPELWLNRDEQDLLVGRYGGYLDATDHAARLDNLLWSGRVFEAQRMYPLVGPGLQAVAEARLRMAQRQSGVDAAVNAVPADLMNDPGLIYERLRYRRRADLLQGAIDMLDRQPIAPSHAEDWWTERHIIARRLFNQGDYQRAYQVAADHRFSSGLPVTEAEFLAGWVALRFLNRPDLAIGHFQNLYSNVSAPISVARAAYWIARTHAAQGDEAGAREWYRRGAQYPTTFYGQLSAGQLGLPTIAALPADPAISPAAEASYDAQELPRVIRLLTQIGRTDLAGTFFNALIAEAHDASSYALIARLALSLDQPYFAVRAGKAAVQDGFIINEASYPVISLPDGLEAERPLVLAVIRQESEFNPQAVSSAGARGLMQLMPGTATQVARRIGLTTSGSALIGDPAHNVLLGANYLADLLQRYDGSILLALIAYNAGPDRVAQWIAGMGDPRLPNVDVVDWIERIPIGETRNYVQRVLENTEVYRARLGEPPQVGALERDLGR